jgi:hypothetical protein
VLRELRAWADKAHLTAQNIDELRQLVQLQSPQDTPYFRHAGVTMPGYRQCIPGPMTAHLHGSELEDDKPLLIQSDPPLAK